MNRRSRHRIAWIALLGLLFQQLAMAAYVCPMETGAALAAASVSHHCHPAGSSDAARCAEHCHPIVPSGDHAAPLAVPASLVPASAVLVASADARASMPTILETPPRGGAPPPSVMFCTLLI